MLTTDQIKKANDRQFEGESLAAIALEYKVPFGTLRRAVSEWRHIRGLPSIYSIIIETVKDCVRRGASLKDTQDRILLLYNLYIDDDPLQQRMDRVKRKLKPGKQLKIKVEKGKVRELIYEPRGSKTEDLDLFKCSSENLKSA
jgi:hypothetical protein